MTGCRCSSSSSKTTSKTNACAGCCYPNTAKHDIGSHLPPILLTTIPYCAAIVALDTIVCATESIGVCGLFTAVFFHSLFAFVTKRILQNVGFESRRFVLCGLFTAVFFHSLVAF